MISSEFLTCFRTRSDPELRKNCKDFQTIRGSGRWLLLVGTLLTQDGARAEMQLILPRDLQSDFISQRDCRPCFTSSAAVRYPGQSPSPAINQFNQANLRHCDQFKGKDVACEPKNVTLNLFDFSYILMLLLFLVFFFFEASGCELDRPH